MMEAHVQWLYQRLSNITCDFRFIQEVEKENSGTTRESRKGSFAYLAPLWIVILAFAVPATVFIVWKASQKCKSRNNFGNDFLNCQSYFP